MCWAFFLSCNTKPEFHDEKNYYCSYPDCHFYPILKGSIVIKNGHLSYKDSEFQGISQVNETSYSRALRSEEP